MPNDGFLGGEFYGFSAEEIEKLSEKYPWIKRALTTGKYKNVQRGGGSPPSTVSTITTSEGNVHYVVPTIRDDPSGNLYEIKDWREADRIGKQRGDRIPFNTPEEADAFSKGLSKYLGDERRKKKQYGSGRNTEQSIIKSIMNILSGK